jgi:hypothetical protein
VSDPYVRTERKIPFADAVRVWRLVWKSNESNRATVGLLFYLGNLYANAYAISFSVRLCMCINDWDVHSSAAGTVEPRRTEAEAESTWETWRSCGPDWEPLVGQAEASSWGQRTVLANTEERSHIAVVERDSLTYALDTAGTVHIAASV